MTDILKALRAPFPPDRVSWRIGPTTADKSRGLAMCYIDARDVMERLDEVCGLGGWQCRYPHVGQKTVCEIGIKIGDEWLWRANGAGDTDMEAEKGALSDALKRSAVCWGIGRYLYDVPSQWVDIEPAGRSFKIKESELRRLAGILSGGSGAPPKGLNGAMERLATELIAELRQNKTAPALDAWKDRSDIKARILALDEPNGARVRADYTTQMRKLLDAPAWAA